MYAKGWIVRLRRREDKTDLEVSYKYRIPVRTTIKDALEEAARLGWDADELDYDYQVDWSLEKKTLSISRKKKARGIAQRKLDFPDDKRGPRNCN